jgi:hypothetical protein
MSRTITILFFLFIGIFASSITALACCKSVANKEQASKIHHKESKSVQANCCENQTKGIGHDCNKKCKNHNCDCSTISIFSFLNKWLKTELIVLTYPIQKRFSLYKPSFYHDVYITIWHPPKIV